MRAVTLVIMGFVVCQPSVWIPRVLPLAFPASSFHASSGSPFSSAPLAPLLQPGPTPEPSLQSNIFTENNSFLHTNGGGGNDTQDRAVCLCVHFIGQPLLDSLHVVETRLGLAVEGWSGHLLVLKVPRNETRSRRGWGNVLSFLPPVPVADTDNRSTCLPC